MCEPTATSLVILDRDGVINQDSDDYIRSVDEWIPIPGSIDAIARLSRAGFKVAVATNQSGIGRGYYSDDALAQMHALMYTLVEEAGGHIAALSYCPHLPNAGCACRKPLPGLLDAIAQELHLPLEHAWFVGDTGKDIETALSRNCRPILVLSGKGERTLASLSPHLRAAAVVVPDLAAAATYILTTTPRLP
ncbi:MAG: D-glycero-beta-D-manno-heptose 1,7-bisphosphate 7-phosphatase [Pseudomonadales bacterium]|jgi:D-glycero-D-manno-heptose 1,7-bisphosphate phosphatase|nr:D-glycero-beta-D-manno-heptose 1,7-bisphosphate 7-phosphatase [Pseudomonadales bacterium]